MKPIEESFIDWESLAFGFGYGTGEQHVFRALKGFFDLIGKNPDLPHSYDYEQLEESLTAPVTWLLINALCRHPVNIIEYGSSPRFGWLTAEGIALKAFVDAHTVGELEALQIDNYIPCAPNCCNCGPNGYQEGIKCQNPFWS